MLSTAIIIAVHNSKKKKTARNRNAFFIKYSRISLCDNPFLYRVIYSLVNEYDGTVSNKTLNMVLKIVVYVIGLLTA